MFLNIFNNLNNDSKKDNNTQDFLNELKEQIDRSENTNQDIINDNMYILDKIQSENRVSIGTKNKMESKMDEILLEYAKETTYKGELYYIVEKIDDEFVVYKYEDLNDSVLKIKEDELPENALVNSALRFSDDSYIVDEEDTIELKQRITNMANELIEVQDEILKSYRKEGHLYKVSERINDSIFLHDITDNPRFEVEEVDFPQELLEHAFEGAIFEYIDGNYKLKGGE